MLLTNLDPCAINLPHIHPSATELLFVLKGSMKTTFVEENGGRTIVNVVNASQTTVFPRGLIHE
jgi:oxalate decarboxylase/phosphoglucose isomerase-like protein (cupin superfamily)